MKGEHRLLVHLGRLDRRDPTGSELFLSVSSGYTDGISIEIEKEKVPLEKDDGGVIRVGGTRVTLDSLIAAFQEGATAEEIAQQYPSLLLADVYAVIGYYLRHRSIVDEYLRHRESDRADVRKENESRFDPRGIRDRLLARRPRSSDRP